MSKSHRLDVHGDVGYRTLNKLAQLYELPDFVKEADQEATLTLPKGANHYADVRVPYQFPCHTKAATALSMLFFTENQHQINPQVRPLVAERLQKFAHYWGISPYWSELQEKRAALNESGELTDSDYALVTVVGERKERHFPLRNGKEVQAAAQWFSTYTPQLREQFHFSDRQTIARRILDKAAEFASALSSELQDSLEKVAGVGLGVPAEIAQLLRNRCLAGQGVAKTAREGMLKLASQMELQPVTFVDPTFLGSVAETVDLFDRSYGLLNKYSERLPAPEDVIFAATARKMSEVRDTSITTITGATYTVEQLQKLSVSSVRDLFGDEVADAVTTGLRLDVQKLAEVATTLPLPDARMLDDLMSDMGEYPVEKQAMPLGFPPELLDQLAAASQV